MRAFLPLPSFKPDGDCAAWLLTIGRLSLRCAKPSSARFERGIGQLQAFAGDNMGADLGLCGAQGSVGCTGLPTETSASMRAMTSAPLAE